MKYLRTLLFSISDVNLKFNKPEIYVTIDRDKAQSMGVSVIDIAQTLQLSLSGQRFGVFYDEWKAISSYRSIRQKR